MALAALQIVGDVAGIEPERDVAEGHPLHEGLHVGVARRLFDVIDVITLAAAIEAIVPGQAVVHAQTRDVMAKAQRQSATVIECKAAVDAQEGVCHLGVLHVELRGEQQIGHVDHAHADARTHVHAVNLAIADIAIGGFQRGGGRGHVHAVDHINVLGIVHVAIHHTDVVGQTELEAQLCLDDLFLLQVGIARLGVLVIVLIV